MEILLEVILDIVLEGSIEIASDKKVPLPIQIVGTIIIAMVYFGILGSLLYLGIHNNSWIILLIDGCFLLLTVFAVWKGYKRYKR